MRNKTKKAQSINAREGANNLKIFECEFVVLSFFDELFHKIGDGSQPFEIRIFDHWSEKSAVCVDSNVDINRVITTYNIIRTPFGVRLRNFSTSNCCRFDYEIVQREFIFVVCFRV
jgi:hypothetical protein